ncbi:hypothetical protein BCR41DRAFT_357698 [Lobosporangium transversale]|uniref:Uncharacterized protein n=1 Tax=Lobosporangium transversale TaxID=64571 RepID=A0A1Y2GIN5_9FUNG|nr:hypothetical protein BCR41DRAFT_357698 [Lobosporangium transversale]ORZ10286.1 hypothetical protein BCR41DRAFT_357698 [Lobosporangium transversale]|eukprot:XP_021879193.1 hypothetical protein BCR41DRAFT_357698 [Lobosporangium transversale]
MIGAIVGAIAIAGAIGVWVFRKWKLSPSRQFKSKISGGTTVGSGSCIASTNVAGGTGGTGGAYASSHEEMTEYTQSYDNIYHLHGQQQLSSAMSSPSVAYQHEHSQHHSPYAYHQEYDQYQQDYHQQMQGYSQDYQPDYTQDYSQQQYPLPLNPQHHQAHLTMSDNPDSVTDYGQYRQGHAGSTAGTTAAPSHGAGTTGGLPPAGHNISAYGSDDYVQNDQFLRELRE